MARIFDRSGHSGGGYGIQLRARGSRRVGKVVRRAESGTYARYADTKRTWYQLAGRAHTVADCGYLVAIRRNHGRGTAQGRPADLELSVDGAATGNTGCNQFSGHYVSAGADLSFTDVGYTKMMCSANLMAVERAVQQALTRTTQMATPPGQLDLLASDGTVIGRLTAVT